jgi:pimeloyl-ACP methyl ester carboxylesterase
MAALAIKVTRAALRIASLHSAEFAGRAAFALFARSPSKKPQSKKEAEAIARAAPRLKMARRVELVTAGGSIAAHDFAPLAGQTPRGTVLVVHGYRSRSEHMIPIVNALTAEGFRAVALDLPGHGASGGRRTHLLACVEAVDACWREFGPFDGFVGHSFGAATVIAAASGVIPSVPARKPGRLVTIASPTRLQELFDFFTGMMRLSPAVKAAVEEQVLHLTGRPLKDYDAAENLATIDTPTLVLHAPDDKEVDFGNAQRLALAGDHVRLAPVESYGHRRILAAPEALGEIVEFLAAGDSGKSAAAMQNSAPNDMPGHSRMSEARRRA